MAQWQRIIRKGVAAGVLLGVSVAAAAQGLPPTLANIWLKNSLPSHALSVVVQEMGGERLVALNPQEPRSPASVMKLITTWAALSELGPDYTWHTEFLADRGVQPDSYGRLRGPLYLRAGGDPQFLPHDLWTLLRELRLRGIKQISELVIDRSIFGDVAIDPWAFDDAGDRVYNASPDALMVGFGALRLLFIPDPASRRWTPVVDPPLPGFKIEGQVAWLDGHCAERPEVSTHPVMTAQGVSIRLEGKVAGVCGEFSAYRLALPQDAYFNALFRLLWRELGGTFKGKVRAGTVPSDAIVLARHQSPMLGQTIRTINKLSNNVMARTLLLTLGAERGSRPATVHTSAAIATQVLRRQGVSAPELVIDNGSGLSRNARVSADSIAAMLNVAWNSPYMAEFVSSLSIVGRDGTTRERLTTTPAQGMAHLKTGTLRDVKAIAGYVQGVSGKRYVVVSIVNHDQAALVNAFNDALIEWVAAQ